MRENDEITTERPQVSLPSSSNARSSQPKETIYKKRRTNSQLKIRKEERRRRIE